MNINRFFAMTSSALVLTSLLFSSPTLAQGNGEPPPYGISHNLSDVTGPFLGNTTVQVPSGATSAPRTVSVWVALPDLLTQSLASQSGLNTGPNKNTSGALVNAAISFNNSMDKLLPFCGCANPRWRSYNHTVKAAGQLRQALAGAVTEQRQILMSNPTPEQLDAAQKRLKALEDTTMALEKATEVLTALSNALDKAR